MQTGFRYRYFNQDKLVLALFVAAFLLRLIQWVYNRALWVDESMLALNIVESDYLALLQPLKYFQVAPILFLWTEKFMIGLFGDHEISLRLFPLLCGMASLYLLYRITLEISGSKTAGILLLVLAGFSRQLVFFATETKQYSSDLLIACMVLFTLLTTTTWIARRRYFWFLLLGLTAIFLSNISIILISSAAAWIFLQQLKDRKFVYGPWMVIMMLFAAFSTYYYWFIHGHPSSDAMEGFWTDHFLPSNPISISFWKWLVQHFIANYASLSGFNNHTPFVIRLITGSLLAVSAIYGSYRLIKEDKKGILLLLLPVVIHLAVSALHLYPFNGRLILYLTPGLFIPAAIGIASVVSTTGFRVIPYTAGLSAALFIGYSFFWMPVRQEETRDCIVFIKQHDAESRNVYAFRASIHAVNYYHREQYEIEKGRLDSTFQLSYGRSISELRSYLKENSPAWVIVSHQEADEKAVLDSSNAIIMKSYRTNGAAAHLLQLKP